MEHRARRNRIPNEHRESRIVRAFEDPHEDYLLVADMLGVNRSTARGIEATYVREGRPHERPRGGRNNVKVDDEMKQCLSEIVDENCLLTLSEINLELSKKTPSKASRTRTFGKAFDGMLIRIKLARSLPADRNRPDVIPRRVEYPNWFMTNGILHHCVFIDECGYNIWTARSHGRARIGERAYRQVLGHRGRNVTITIAVSYRRFSPLHCTSWYTHAQLFNDFLGQARRQLNPDELIYLTYDGAPAHRNAVNPAANTELKILPAYSPFLNMVEHSKRSVR